MVPQLERLVAGVEPDAVAERRRERNVSVAVLFPKRLRRQHRRLRMPRRLVIRPLQGRFGNQKIIDEQLPADVDGNDVRRLNQIGGVCGTSRSNFSGFGGH